MSAAHALGHRVQGEGSGDRDIETLGEAAHGNVHDAVGGLVGGAIVVWALRKVLGAPAAKGEVLRKVLGGKEDNWP